MCIFLCSCTVFGRTSSLCCRIRIRERAESSRGNLLRVVSLMNSFVNGPPDSQFYYNYRRACGWLVFLVSLRATPLVALREHSYSESEPLGQYRRSVRPAPALNVTSIAAVENRINGNWADIKRLVFLIWLSVQKHNLWNLTRNFISMTINSWNLIHGFWKFQSCTIMLKNRCAVH